MKKTGDFSQTTSSQFRQPQGYRTLNGFPRGQSPSLHSDAERHGEFHSDGGCDIELIRQVVQSEMTGLLLIIKTEIEQKINSIDEEIRGLRQEIFKIHDCSDCQKLHSRVQKLEKSSASLAVPNLIVRDRSQPSVVRERTTQQESGMLKDKSERSLSKDRKPIFPKGESSLNLSNILFPEEESQRLMRSRLEYKEQIQHLHEPKFDQPLPISKVELPRSFQHDDKSDPVIHELVQEMSCNKNKFLRNKSQRMVEQQPLIISSAGTPALPIVRDANLTIPEEDQEQSIIDSGKKR